MLNKLKNRVKEIRDYWVIKRSGLFDREYYLRNNLDVARSCKNPIMHYIRHGWREGRNPNKYFNNNWYLKTYPDVSQAGLNPLYHYLKHSIGEKCSVINNLLVGRSYSPKVTVIVPSYNNASYLKKRLDCIYNQSYSNFNVILLDDCSTDDSQMILNEYQRKYTENTFCIFNQKNSGDVFRQWKKGIELADGEIIWIAESDDFADENFLETLVPFFADESVRLAYARSKFVDSKGHSTPFAFELYLSDIDNRRWKHDYIKTACEEVVQALGYKNTIPNVSGAIFRKINISILNNADWMKMKVCGDWIFYLHLIRGGKIAYSTCTTNYFRFHSSKSSPKTYRSDVYYREHEEVARSIASLYKVPENVLQKNHQIIKKFWHENYAMHTNKPFENVFDYNKVKLAIHKRKPNILIVGFAFSLGGGEIFPIYLANELKKRDYGITYFDYGYYPEDNPKVRSLLRKEIPVVKRKSYLSVENLLQEFSIDIVHTHHAFTDKFFAEHTIKNVKHVVTLHGMYEMFSETVLRDLVTLLTGKIDRWVYVSDKNITPFISHGCYKIERFIKIGNGMALPYFSAVDRRKLEISKKAFVLCLASRALPEKGWLEAIEATQKAREISGKDIHLLLLGDGVVYDQLCKQGDVSEYIHLLGFQENVTDYYAMSDAGILPSYFKGESFPLSIIECLFAGKPVIASDIGEIRNMLTIDDGLAGVLFALENDGKIPIDDLAAIIMDFAARGTTYTKAKKRVPECAAKFHIGNVVDKYESVYASVSK